MRLNGRDWLSEWLSDAMKTRDALTHLKIALTEREKIYRKNALANKKMLNKKMPFQTKEIFCWQKFFFEQNLFLTQFIFSTYTFCFPKKIIGGNFVWHFCLENISMFDTKNLLQINNAQFWPLSDLSGSFLASVRENFLYIYCWLYCIYTGQVQFDNTLTFESLMH